MPKRQRRPSPHMFVALLLVAAMGLAAVVVMLMTPEERPLPDPPEMAFVDDEDEGVLLVAETEPGLAWDDFRVQLDRRGGVWVEEGAWAFDLDPLVFVALVDADVDEGDRLVFCVDEGSGELEVALLHAPSNQVVGSWHFPDVRNCDEVGT